MWGIQQLILIWLRLRYNFFRIIKMSSPNLNYLICGGAVILYTGVIVNGIIADDQVQGTGQSGILAVSCSVNYTARVGAEGVFTELL